MQPAFNMRLIFALTLPATMLTSAAHATMSVIAGTDATQEEGRPGNRFPYILAQLSTHWMGIGPAVNSATSLSNSNGNGSLQLCQPKGFGYSHGYNAEDFSLGCGLDYSFSLNNSGTVAGKDGFTTSSAQVTGYVNGRIEIRGDNGVTIKGRTTFDSAANLSNHQINALAAATADTDAVNLHQVKSVTSSLGGNAKFNADGSFTGPAYDLRNGGKQTTVGNALNVLDEAIARNAYDISGLDSRVTTNEADITTVNNRLAGIIDGDTGIVQQSTGTGIINVGRSLGGNVVDLAGADGPRVLSGIANGTRDTDAASLAQLRAMGLYDPVNNRILGALLYDDNTLGRSTLGGTHGTVIANLAGGLVAEGSREAINGGQLFDMRIDLQDQLNDLDERVGRIEDDIVDSGDGITRGGGGGGGGNDAGGEPIKNIGDGEDITDAASVGQVNDALKAANVYTETRYNEINESLNVFKNDVNRRFQRMNSRIDRMGAISSAQTQMAINASGAITTRGRLAVGLGLQNGRSALAVGYATRMTERVSLSIGAAFSGSENNAGAGIGVDL